MLTSRRARVVMVLLAVVAGVGFGRTMSYDIYNYAVVVQIEGNSGSGCEGEFGAGPVYFRAWQRYTVDGVYSLKCDERLALGHEAWIACHCPLP